MADELSGVVVCCNRTGGFDDLEDEVLLALGDEDGRPFEQARGHGDSGVEGQRPVEDGRAGIAARVGEQQPAGEGGATAEADQQHRTTHGRDLVQPRPEPVHGLAQRTLERPPDAPVGEPGVAAAFADRGPDRRVRRPAG